MMVEMLVLVVRGCDGSDDVKDVGSGGDGTGAACWVW